MPFETKPGFGSKYTFQKIITPGKTYLEGFYGNVEYDSTAKMFNITQFDKDKKPMRIRLNYDHIVLLSTIIKEVK